MKTFNRILGMLVIGLSVLAILLSVGGVFSAWIVNERLTNALTYLVNAAQTTLGVVDHTLERAETALTSVQADIRTVENAATQFGATVEESRPALELVSRTIGEDIAPKIATTRQTVATVRDTVVAFNQTLETMNVIPGIQVPTLTDQLQAVSDRLAEMAVQIEELRTAVAEFRSGVATTIVTPITTRTTFLLNETDAILADVQAFRDRAVELDSQLDVVEEKVAFWIDIVSTALTVVLLWAVFGQVALIYMAWKYLQFGYLPGQQPEATPAPVPVQ